MANNIMRFDPFGDVSRFEPVRGIDQYLRNFHLKQIANELDTEPRIRMDVSESDGGYTVRAEIPGVRKEEINISIEGNQVSISAEVKREREERKGETIVRSERYYGQQMRCFALAHDIDDARVVARYQDGVLELSLPKKAGNGRTRQINVQ